MGNMGTIPAVGYESSVVQTFSSPTGTSHTMTYTADVNDMVLVINNVIQEPTVAYTTSGTTLTTDTLVSGDTMYIIFLALTRQTVAPGASTVTNAMMVDDAVGVAELSATGTASATTFLRGDNAWTAPTVNATIDTMTGDGSDVTLALSVSPGSENNVQITFDGVTQHHSTFSLAGSTITFSTAPATGVAVEAISGGSTTTGTPDNNTVNLAQLASGTDGELFTWDTSGDPAKVAVGTATHVLTSNGVGAAPTFQAAGGVDSITDNGTEEAINIDSNEIVTMPKQPGFDAYVNAVQTDETGDGTGFAITGAIWTELSDKNADFSNGTFTAPVAGLYLFTAMLSITDATTSVTLFDFNLVLSNAERRMFLSNNYGSVTGTNFIMTGALIAFMDASDTASLLVTVSGISKLVDIGSGDDSRTTRFSGVLLS